jgi:hypothetical protein
MILAHQGSPGCRRHPQCCLGVVRSVAQRSVTRTQQLSTGSHSGNPWDQILTQGRRVPRLPRLSY